MKRSCISTSHRYLVGPVRHDERERGRQRQRQGASAEPVQGERGFLVLILHRLPGMRLKKASRNESFARLWEARKRIQKLGRYDR